MSSLAMTTGICLGGPMHGSPYASQTGNEFHLAGNPDQMNLISPMTTEAEYLRFKRGTYRFDKLALSGEARDEVVGVWIWCGWR